MWCKKRWFRSFMKEVNTCCQQRLEHWSWSKLGATGTDEQREGSWELLLKTDARCNQLTWNLEKDDEVRVNCFIHISYHIIYVMFDISCQIFILKYLRQKQGFAGDRSTGRDYQATWSCFQQSCNMVCCSNTMLQPNAWIANVSLQGLKENKIRLKNIKRYCAKDKFPDPDPLHQNFPCSL